MDPKKIDLNAPAFGPGSQKVADISDENKAPEPEQKPEIVEKEEVAPKEPVTPAGEEEEPKRVPYSRFKNVWSAKEEAERKLVESASEIERWKKQAEQRGELISDTKGADMPSWWVKLYGDSPESKDAWKIQEAANSELRTQITQEARERALEALKNEKFEEEKRLNDNVDTIDSNLEQLQDFVGRELTEKEQSSVLDIIDDFTPKDSEGNYIGALLPFEKAWEIYELKSSSQKSQSKQSRDNVAALNSNQGQGDPSAQAEINKNFNPSWSAVGEAVRRRLGQ